MSREFYDIVVIGAGIHGAGIAQAAAARGHSVLVLEQTGIAAGTSGRSSKLIHGGLRYLESAQFSLVRECLRERALLLRLAPDLVRLRPFHIPVYKDTRRRPWQLRLGLSLYALLAGLGPSARYHTLPRRTWHTLDGLDTRSLEQVFQYQDAQTDDHALTRAVMRSASSLGAQLTMPAMFLGADCSGKGCSILYSHEEREISCDARVLVNAAGPWVNQVLDLINPRIEPRRIDLVQGTHLVLDGTLNRGIYYLESPRDRRAVFAMPWHGKVLVGTTETPYDGDPAMATPLANERRYLLETFRHYFPDYGATGQVCIVDAFAGLRVLPHDSRAIRNRARESMLNVDRPERPRVLTLYGGKLTAYRTTADKIMKRLESSLPERKPIASTTELHLPADDPHMNS